MPKIVTTIVAILDLQMKAMELVKTFDKEFTTFVEVTLAQAQVSNDATLFNIVCTNVQNGLEELDGNIKGLRKHIDEGKKLYRQCVQSYKYLIGLKF